MQSQDGTAAVVGGALVVVPPGPGGRRAVVRSEAGVELLAPGREPGQGPIEAGAPGEIDVRLYEDAPRLDVRVTVTADELLATVAVERVPGARYRLEDQPPNQSITLRRLVAGRIACPAPTLHELRMALAEHGVVQGISGDALHRLFEGSFQEHVARGVAAVPPVEAGVQLHALDARGGDRFVRAGTLLARVSPARPGEDGFTVTGRVLGVAEPRPPELRVGDGAIVESDGRVMATTEGQARFSDGVVTVTAALVHEGDVRASDGELSSPGSIEVTGSVEDGLVRAKRAVAVGDAVRRSTVEAGHTLTIGGPAFDSTLRVGRAYAALLALRARTEPLARDLARVQGGVGQLAAASQAAGREVQPLRLLAMVLERIAPELPSQIKAALAEADRDRGSVPFDVLAALRAAQEDLDAVCVGRLPLTSLATVAGTFARQTDRLGELTAERPRCTVALLQKCDVDVIGELHVTGKGVVESALVVKGRLVAPEAVLRGGSLRLHGTATVDELEPGTGSGLVVTLAAGSVLEARQAHAGVRVELPGGQVQRLATSTTDLRVAADPAAA